MDVSFLLNSANKLKEKNRKTRLRSMFHIADVFLYLTVTCPELIVPYYGNVSVSDEFLGVGDNATFTCAEGYSLVGNEMLTCLPSGQWDSEEPSCNGSYEV